MIPRAGVAPLLLLGFFATDGAQAPEETVFRIGVNLVQVDAVVADSKGRPVPDLDARDFEVLQDGKRQTITNFSYIRTQAGPIPEAPPAQKGKGAARPKVAPPRVPPAPLRQEQVRRTIVLAVDDLGIAGENIPFVRRALTKFVEEQMQPNDLAAIVRTGSSVGLLQQFTSDKRQLLAAVERVRWNSMGRVGLNSFLPIGDWTRILWTDHGGAATWIALDYFVNGMRELPGRKSMVLFCESFGNPDGLTNRLAELANRAGVVIYPIDPRGLPTFFLKRQDNLSREISAAVDDPKRLLLDGTLRLDEKLAAGDYILQLIVTDKLADKKSQTASQWIDFEVAP